MGSTLGQLFCLLGRFTARQGRDQGCGRRGGTVGRGRVPEGARWAQAGRPGGRAERAHLGWQLRGKGRCTCAPARQHLATSAPPGLSKAPATSFGPEGSILAGDPGRVGVPSDCGDISLLVESPEPRSPARPSWPQPGPLVGSSGTAEKRVPAQAGGSRRGRLQPQQLDSLLIKPGLLSRTCN